MSRAGLAFIGRCKQAVDVPPRAIPFQFSNNQGYVLEFGHQYLRFVFQGGYVVETPVAISGATRANPCVISVTGTPFANGDWVFASGVGGMTQLNGNTYIVASVAAGHFSLHDLNGNPVDSSAYSPYTAGGTFARIYTIASPYAVEDLIYLKYAQTADVMALTCANPETGHEYPPYDLSRLAAASWTLQPTNFDAVITAPTWVSAGSNMQAPTNGVNASFAYQVTAVNANGDESVASDIATCHGADLQVEAGTNTITWAAVALAKYYNVYRAPVSTDSGMVLVPVPEGSILGFVGSSFGTQFVDNNTTPDLTLTPPTHRNPFAPGQILAVNITGGGSGQEALAYVVTTAVGTGFTGRPALISGSMGAFQITNNGKGYAPGDSIAFNGAGFASGSIEFGATNPTAGDTITLNGIVWTFVSAATGANQTVIGGSLATTLTTLVAGLSSSVDPTLAAASYALDVTSANLLISYKTAGTGGNAYTLAASRATRSGATLTGGSGSGTAGTAASGSLHFGAGNPVAAQNIVLNGLTWTFVAGASGLHETTIGANLAATMTQLASDLNASSATQINVASYSGTATDLDISYDTVGAIGNTYTLNGGTATATASAASLTGGTDASADPTATLTVGPTSGTYPGVNAFFQQRHFFAYTFNNPDTVFASQTGRYKNMDVGIPTIATDAITASPWTEQVNGIQWMIPMPGGMIVMTGLRAWQLLGAGGGTFNLQALTPSSIEAQPQAFNGCSATIPPIVIDYDVLYVQAIGATSVFDLSYNFYVNIYTGNDLTILSSHLFLSRHITQWAWSRQPYKILWSCCDDGTMMSLTYLKEQNVYGWARHDTQGIVVSLASITEPPTNAVYAIVKRFPPYAPAGIYCMERFDNRIWQSVEDTYALDSAVSNPMSSPDVALRASSTSGAVTFTSAAAAFSAGSVGQIIRMGGGIATVTGYTSSTIVTGTWNLASTNGAPGFPYAPAGSWTIATPVTSLSAPHLAGMTVSALADGVPLAGITVASNGDIPLPFAASNAKAGLPFTVQIQTPYLNGEGTVQGARKVIPAATIRLAASGQFQFGTNQPDGPAQDPPVMAPTWSDMATADPLQPTGGQNAATTYTSPGGQTVTQLWTGDLRVVGEGAGWISKGQVAIQQTLPLPLQVLAVMPEQLPGEVPEVKAQPRQQASGGQAATEGPPQGPGAWMIRGRGGI